MFVCVVSIREQDRVSITPSPIDDFLGHPAKSEIPAWKSANQELAGVLKNLRKMEHHLHCESAGLAFILMVFSSRCI